MLNIFVRKSLAVTVAVAFGVSGCANIGGPQNGEASSGDSCGIGTVSLAAVICGLGGLVFKNKDTAGKAAAICGAVTAGYCFFKNSETQTTKTATEVNETYSSKNRGNLPATPTVTEYTTQLTPQNGRVPRGGEVQLLSQAQIVDGQSGKVGKVEEEITLSFDEMPDKTIQKAVKPVANNAGAFKNTTTIRVPEKFPQGSYSITSRMLIDGAPAKTPPKVTKMQVVWVSGDTRIALNDVSGATTPVVAN
ncbi:hypothetical protein FACS1894158_06350 [Betaproteobacteria bacterium]|nr:hypothetical protein FACS1894158_06350 [Betaproteobacteria bacterium]